MTFRIPDTVFNGLMQWMKRDPWPGHFNDALENHLHACSIRLDQALLFSHFRSALISALASSMSFLMSAVSATFGGLPALIMA